MTGAPGTDQVRDDIADDTAGDGADDTAEDVGGPDGRLLEREHELGRLERCVRDAVDGQGQLVLIEGPAGVGKTTLVRAATASARRRGVTVLAARGVPLEREFAYGVVRQLYEPLIRPGGRSSGMTRFGDPLERDRPDGPGPDRIPTDEILAGAAGLALPAIAPAVERDPSVAGQADDRSFAVRHGLYWLTANLAGRNPLALLVDDAHWADDASLRFVAHLGSRLAGLPVLVIVVLRSGDPPASFELVAELRALADGEPVRPGLLGADAATRLLRADLAGATDGFCRAGHAATGGNPLLLRSLIAAVAAEGIRPDDDAAARAARLGAEGVARGLARRLSLLPAGTDDVVRALAVLGRGASLRNVATLAGLDLERATALADTLRAASLLAPTWELDFAHPVLRFAAEELMGPDARALAHHRAAGLIAADGSAPERVALHLLRAQRRGDAAVVATLRAAADIASHRGAPDTATTYLRRALDEPPPADQRGSLVLDLALAEMAIRRDPRAVAGFREALELIDRPADRLSAALLAGRALGVGGFFEEAAAMLAQADGCDPRVEAELAANRCQLTAHAPGALALLARHRESDLPPGAGAAALRVMLAHTRLFAGGRADVVADLLERATRGPELFAEESLVPVYAAMDLIAVDRFDDAEALCTAVIQDARRRGAVSVAATFSFPRAFALLRRGRLRDAEMDARWSFEQKMSMGAEQGPPWPASCLVDTLTELGDLPAAEAVLVRLAQRQPGEPEVLAWAFLTEARGRLRIAQGRSEAGIGDLTAAGGRWDRLRCRAVGHARWRVDAADALARVGELGEARRLAAEQLELATAAGLPLAIGVATRVAGAVAPGPDRPALLARAVDLLEPTPARIEVARALVDLGSAVRRDGHPARAREPLRRGLDIAHRAGAAPLARRARDELVAAGFRPRRPAVTGVEALTAGELRVARLVAEGRTNRETAEQLFLTQRTVETHLGHVFRKLGIRGRDELPRALAAPVNRGAARGR